MPSSLAFARTASSVRPSFNPITRVGVFSFASCRSCLTSSAVHGLPVFLVDFVVIDISLVIYCLNALHVSRARTMPIRRLYKTIEYRTTSILGGDILLYHLKPRFKVISTQVETDLALTKKFINSLRAYLQESCSFTLIIFRNFQST
jgi:hypothetical protein